MPAEIKAIAQEDAQWLSHHLDGGPAPSGLPVRVFLQQTKKWLDFAEWPPPQHQLVSQYLRAEGGLDREPEAADAKPAWFIYDPADPTPTVGGPVLQPPGKQADNAPVKTRTDVLTYTSPPLAADQNLIGPVSARIYVRTEREYADVFVRLCDVDTGGVSRNVTDGIRRLNPRTGPGPGRPAGNGTAYWRSMSNSSRRPTGCWPATGCGCRSAAAGSRGSRATSAPASRSGSPRPDCGASSRSSRTRSIRPGSCCRTATADSSAEGAGGRT